MNPYKPAWKENKGTIVIVGEWYVSDNTIINSQGHVS